MPRKRTASRGRSRSRQRGSLAEPRPIPGPDAFRDLQERTHVRSQAATLLLIGSHLRGDALATHARAEAARSLVRSGVPGAVQPLPDEDVRALGFPGLPAGTPRFRPEDLQQVSGTRFAAAPAAEPRPPELRAAGRRLLPVAQAFYRSASAETAAALLEVSLRHPHELVRVSAAASYFEVTTNPVRAIRALAHGMRTGDPLTRDVAAHALAHVDPGNPALVKLLASRTRRSTRKRSRTSLIVHGTWARTSAWWQPPSGDFWRYVHDTVDANLYGAQDRFEWSGGYSDAARALAGNDLSAWVQQHNLQGLDVVTHSHGGSVAMLANHAGTRVGRMVLLSCPVHWPQYTPASTLVGSVVSVRVHLDLVILADRGGQRFNDTRIRENVLPIWFDHFAAHDPDVWRQYDVPAML